MARRSEDDPRMRVWVDFLFAHQRVTRALETELKRDHGITSAQYDVLLHLWRAPDRRLRMSEVAGAILYSSGAATKLLDSLVRAGLVVRESSPDDRRTVWAALTPTGKDLFVKAGRQHVEVIKREFAAYLRDDELEPVQRFLHRLADPAANAN